MTLCCLLLLTVLLRGTEGTNLLLSCWKQTKVNSLMETRRKVWRYHVSQNNTSAPKLESLPPTSEVFLGNFKKALWLYLLQQYGEILWVLTHPPIFNPLDYVWAWDPSSPCLMPRIAKDDNLLKIISFGCSSEYPWKTKGCLCTKLGLACSIVCEWEVYVTCCKPGTQKALAGNKNIEEKNWTDWIKYKHAIFIVTSMIVVYLTLTSILLFLNFLKNLFLILSEYASISPRAKFYVNF